MNTKTIQVHIVFLWPEGEPSEDYEAGEEVEVDWTFPGGVPVPNAGDYVVFDPEEPPVEGIDHPIGQGSPSRRWFGGDVVCREFTFSTTRYENMTNDYAVVRLTVGPVRRTQ